MASKFPKPSLANLDKMSNYDILRIWRFAPSDSPWMQGELGAAFGKAYNNMRDNLSAEQFTALSKQVGWSQ